jgi:tetratricopeptide (TPR) repeat protein
MSVPASQAPTKTTKPLYSTKEPDEYILKMFREADALRAAGKNEEALKVIDKAIWFDSDCGKCLGLRSGIYGNLGQFPKGVGDGDLGTKKSTTPRDKAMSAYNKGFNLAGLNKRSEALTAFDDCIDFDPKFAMCHFGKGKTLYELDDVAKAAAEIHQALDINPKHGPSWAYSAFIEASADNGIAALADGSMAVDLAPRDPRSYRARAAGWMLNENYDQMLADVNTALELDPTRPGAHLLRGRALHLLGRENEAEQEFALETDRAAVQNELHPTPKIDTRIYNCGSFTELQTPTNFNGDNFDECAKRVKEALEAQIQELQARPASKRPVPGLPTKKATKK